MSLEVYKKKRTFSQTPEPKGGKASAKALRFVVQKHAASHLHYDFRLEMEGVLKSWAIPKGPSMDPSIKRLAMMVEDHPYDYRSFEGIIPKGQYGGGTVIVWDEGEYEPAEGSYATKRDQERALLQGVKKGKLTFILHGKKLKGEFHMVKSSYQGENSWLIFKAKDKYANDADVTKKDKSVISGKTIEQVANSVKSRIWNSDRKAKASAKKAPAKKAPAKDAPVKAATSPSGGKRMAMPKHLEPMLATLVDKPFDEPGWLYEVKWDGYRCLAFLNGKKVELRSRNDKSFNEKFYPVRDALAGLELNAIVDGEIVVVNEKGISNFGDLQNWRSEADGELRYYIFDLLWLNGHSMMDLPLTDRRKELLAMMPSSPGLEISQAFETTGTEFFEAARKMGLEGILAKRADSVYAPGSRSKEWLKIKVGNRQEVVIGGFTKNEGSSKSFSSLLVGVYKDGKLHYTGKIGTGFSDALQKEMMAQFKPLIIKTSPFLVDPDVNKPSRFRPDPPQANAVWMKPRLVCEVSYTEMTSDGVMRHPSFEGMRVDKDPEDVTAEVPKKAEKLAKADHMIKGKQIVPPAGNKERNTFLNPGDETQERNVGGHLLSFTHLSKIYWPKEKITKRDMLNYYFQAAPYMLPYMKDRPQSLNRHPNGINGESFYQKDVTGKVPDWIATFPYHSEGDDRDKQFLVCTDEASLLYIASLGCIEMNPWSSRVQSPDNPDFCIIDLDPDTNKFEQVVETAQVTRQVLESAGITGYCKTSGSTGLHIYIPLGAKYTYDDSKEFARLIVTLVHRELPRFTSIERALKDRKGKIYLDFLQNRPQATIATVYSLRPKPGATVSMPLHWEEVRKGLSIGDFTIKNAIARVREEGDLFKPVLGKGINMEKALKALNKMKEG
ncbi:MAG: DNA ligase D [Bacteroidota bacterium]|nr:DNA ligase D [Bacteroidota bacterium]